MRNHKSPEASCSFERLLALSQEMICVVGFDGRFEILNEPWEKALGFRRGELMGRPFADWVYPEDREPARLAMRGMIEGGNSACFESRFLCAREPYRWIRWNGAASVDEKRVYVISSDITERKSAEKEAQALVAAAREELRLEMQARRAAEEQRARLYSLLDHAPVIALVLRGPNHTIELSNEASRRLAGYRGLTWRPIREAIPDLDPGFTEILDGVYRSGRSWNGRAVPYRADWLADGTVSSRVLTLAAEPSYGSDGEIEGVWVVAVDVTESQSSEAGFLVSERMASLGTLVAGIAHEINNPLSFITANLSLALDELGAGNDQAKDSLQSVRQGVNRVRDIVRSLKVFSRNDEEKVELVDLREVLDTSIDIVGNEIRHRALLSLEYEPIPPVRANRGRLCKVFINLLINATQAIEVGAAESNFIRVSVREGGGGKVTVEISDTGRGIPPEELSRVYVPFFTSKPIGEGAGLGLSICHGIISALNGEITVRSEVGIGTVFRVVLPGVREDSTGVESVRSSHAARVDRNLRILIIDDEQALGDAIGRILSKDHHAVTVVNQARKALELLGERSSATADYDLILCDLMMPELTGMDVYEEIKKTRSGLEERIIFMTGGAFTEKSKDWLNGVPNRLLEKPFDADELREVIRAVT